MHARGRVLGLVLALVLVAFGAGGWWLVSIRLASSAAPVLTASGTLELDETLLSAKVSAAIATLPVPVGSDVSAGRVVATLDDTAIQLQIKQALDPVTLRTAQIQDLDYTLHAPVDGTVSRVPAHVGEIANPGEVLLTLATLDPLKLTLYVREVDLSLVSVGQPLVITADPFPRRTFPGTVTSINSQAEFTPRNIQTQDDRLNLVYGVQAQVPNPDRLLKGGMPVSAEFVSASSP
jgi:multidrug resistance efflux pump